MYASRLRSSDGFIIFVVGVAVFTDMMLYGLIVPMLPYALADRVGIAQEDVQQWNSILLGSFGAALMLGSRMSSPSYISLLFSLCHDSVCHCKLQLAAPLLGLLRIRMGHVDKHCQGQ